VNQPRGGYISAREPRGTSLLRNKKIQGGEAEGLSGEREVTELKTFRFYSYRQKLSFLKKGGKNMQVEATRI